MAQEVGSVQAAAQQLCPLHIVLERVVATSSGNILACWQVTSGSDPAAIRRWAHTVDVHAGRDEIFNADGNAGIINTTNWA